MGVRKYRSVADMPEPPAREPLDPENLRLVFSLMRFARSFRTSKYEPGVRKYVSLEAMIEDREVRERPRT
jgi:hypothetical protein